MSGGNYTIDGGFWGILAVVQTPRAPLLSISRIPTNTLAVSWPSPSTGYGLQQNSDLRTTNWFNFAGTVNDNGTTKSATISPPSGTLSFRLKK